MNIFKNYSYTWWQIGIFKAAMLSIGIAIGAHWQAVFTPYVVVLAVVGLVLSCYVATVSFK